MALKKIKLDNYIQFSASIIAEEDSDRNFYVSGSALDSYIDNNFDFTSFFSDLEEEREFVLFHSDNSVLNLPWERILGSRSEAIRDLLIHRSHEEIFRDTEQRAFKPPLRILVLISSPENSPPEKALNFEKEEMSLLQALEPMIIEGKVEIEFMEDAVFSNLEKKLLLNQYHILHVSGHGSYNRWTQEHRIILEQKGSYEEEELEDHQFCGINKAGTPVPFVFMSVCDSASGNEERGQSTGLVNHLLRSGSSSVIAMKSEINDEICTVFVDLFYSEYSRTQDIYRSFQLASGSLKKQNTGSPYLNHTDIPVLYSSQKIDQLVDYDLNPSQTVSENTDSLYFTLKERPKEFRFYGRRRILREARLNLNREGVVYIQGQGGIGKTCLAEKLCQNSKLIDADTDFIVIHSENADLRNFTHEIESLLAKHSILPPYISTALMDSESYFQKYIKPSIEALCKAIHLVVVIDNIESAQSEKFQSFKKEFAWLENIPRMAQQNPKLKCIITGRYPLHLSDIPVINLHSASVADFMKKTADSGLSGTLRWFQIVKSSNHLYAEKSDTHTESQKQVKLTDFVSFIHHKLGGNFRALEFFLSLVEQEPLMWMSLQYSLEEFEENTKTVFEEILENLSEDLVFRRLWDSLTETEKTIARLLAYFRLPVEIRALEYQGIDFSIASEALQRLSGLTIIEIHPGNQYFLTGLTRDLIKSLVPKQPVSFNPKKAGDYYWEYKLQGEVYLDFVEFLHKGSGTGNPAAEENFNSLLTKKKNKFHGELGRQVNMLLNKTIAGILLKDVNTDSLLKNLEEINRFFYNQPLSYSIEAYMHYREAGDYSSLSSITAMICDNYSERQGLYAQSTWWISLTKQLIAPQPLSTELLHRYGAALIYLNQHLHIAQENYEEIIRRTEGKTDFNLTMFVIAKANLAQIMIKRHQYPPALEILLSLENKYADIVMESAFYIFALIGQACYGMGRYKEAESYSLKALQGPAKGPQLASIYYLLGDIYLKFSEKDGFATKESSQKSLGFYDTGLNATPDPGSRFTGNYKKACYFLKHKNYSHAMLYAQKSLQIALFLENENFIDEANKLISEIKRAENKDS